VSMANANGDGVKARNRVVDRVLLVGAGLLIATLSTGAAFISEAYRISPAWLLSLWAAVGFLGIVGKTYGLRNLKSTRFAVFCAVWLLIHVCVFVLVLAYLGFLCYLPFLLAELLLGFIAALWLFGPAARRPT
jgi:FtsH-binding integral membrane protein